MAKRMGSKKPFSEKNVNDVPDQSGVYNLINRQGDIVYTGSAGARRLRERLKEHIDQKDIPGAAQFQVRPTKSTAEAKKVEQELIKRNKPKYNEQGK